MRNLVVGGAWLGSLVLAWLLGTGFTKSGGDTGARSPGERAPAAAERARADPSQGGSGGRAADATAPAPPPASTEAGGSAPGSGAAHDEPGKPFTLEGVTSVEEASARFMAFADAKLKEGPEGHKELLLAMDRIIRDPATKQMLRDESQLVPLAYPWVKFLVDRDRYVVALTETIYRTAAEDPRWFEALDDDTLEPFTEGVAVMLAGVADEEQLARFRAYAEKILAHPPESLPEALQKNLRDFRQNLQFWAPPLSPEDTLKQLMDPSVPAGAKLGLLKRVDPKEVRGVDVAAILAPAVQAGDFEAFRLLDRFSFSAADLVALDRAFIEGVAGGRMQGWYLQQYLRATQRATWTLMEAFVREGLRRGGQATESFAQGLQWLPEQPPKTFVQEVLANYALSAEVASQLKARFQIE